MSGSFWSREEVENLWDTEFGYFGCENDFIVWLLTNAMTNLLAASFFWGMSTAFLPGTHVGVSRKI
jgi:hypothetical protein